MKLKRVTFDGREYLLAPLTFEQVEHLLEEDDSPPRDRAWKAIADSLANAGAERVSVAALKSSLDYHEYCDLNEIVIELSALRSQHSRLPADPEEGPAKPLDFSYMRARLAAHCGWTPAESDRAPFPDVMRLFEYWNEESPPVDPMFASFVGFKPRRRIREREYRDECEDSTRDEKVNLVAQWGGRVIRGADNLPGFLQEALWKDGLLSFPGAPPPASA